MKKLNSNFVAVIMMTCISTIVFLSADRLYQTKHHLVTRPVQKINRSVLNAHASHSSQAKPNRIGPIIRLDEKSHLEPLKKLLKGPILLNFHATWCGPCNIQRQEINDMAAKDLLGSGYVIKIDIDKHPELANQFKVTSIPKFVLLKDGVSVVEKSGVVSRETIHSWLSETPQASQNQAH